MQFDSDMKSLHHKLFLSVREMLLKLDGVEETQKEKITTYTYNGSGLCHIRTMPDGVDVGFLKGAMMSDKFGLLHGDTKRMRVLSLTKFLKKELEFYFTEAMRLNEK